MRQSFLSHRFRLSLGLAVLILAFGTSGGAAFAQPAPLGGGVHVQITQLHWLSDQQGIVLIPYSRIGVAELSFDSLSASLLTSPAGAYLNLYTSLNGSVYQWSVQNLYLRFDNLSAVLNLRPTVQFDLGGPEGQPVGMITVQGSLTPGPQKMPSKDSVRIGPPLHGSTTTMTVGLDDYHVGGYQGAGSGQPGTPAAAARPWQGSGAPAVDWAGTLTPPWLLPAVDEDWMGCAPGGVARSIRYLADLAGGGGPNVQDIYEDLYDYMETNDHGWGTWPWDILGGKADYVDDNDLPIVTSTFGWQNDIGDIMDALDNGADVEIFISWAGGGGHVAMVVGIVEMADGSYEIWYIDDPEQGDGWAENELHVINVRPNGDFGTGWIDGFLVEQVVVP